MLLFFSLVECGGRVGASGADDDGGTSTSGGEDGSGDDATPDVGDDPCPQGTLDCPCYPGDVCNDDLVCDDGICGPPKCGNGVVDEGEECDDGNDIATDDCDVYCNASGEEEWSIIIDGPVSAADAAEGVAIDGDGNIMVAGWVMTNPNANRRDVWLGKLSSDGEVLWTLEHDEDGRDDRAYAVDVLPDGSYAVAGHTITENAQCDVWVARYDTDGGTIWTLTHDGEPSECDAAFGLAATSNGEFVVTGHEDALNGGSHAWTRRYTAGGDTIWTATWGPQPDSVFIGLAVTRVPGGDLVVAGYSEPPQGQGQDWQHVLLRYTGDGELVWALDDPQSGNTVLRGVAIDLAGGILGAGSQGSDALLERWDGAAQETWAVVHEEPSLGYGAGARVGEAVAIDSAGNAILVGHVADGDMFGSGRDALIAKHDPSGELLWIKHYDGPASSHDAANAVAIDDDDHIIVAGMTTDEDPDGDIWVAKYGP